jgi:hypothetical protein
MSSLVAGFLALQLPVTGVPAPTLQLLHPVVPDLLASYLRTLPRRSGLQASRLPSPSIPAHYIQEPFLPALSLSVPSILAPSLQGGINILNNHPLESSGLVADLEHKLEFLFCNLQYRIQGERLPRQHKPTQELGRRLYQESGQDSNRLLILLMALTKQHIEAAYNDRFSTAFKEMLSGSVSHIRVDEELIDFIRVAGGRGGFGWDEQFLRFITGLIPKSMFERFQHTVKELNSG